ncbi:hypothetical protein ABB37_09639 [Leptomonas pyrrhocoris]|uniref:Uncharacterized protein n=1 Tax=Leptomonas pyrrhocoris TaxID=157538 RepID=A0A0N1J499_LEPPY|nr:hypothetical protein ABB37_09639 [Leptomonas pyrrhocoris]KPA73728.1 hypothetical protein ABB37_09639 [Leptomonas pyrrhocoris]|eukprot:XP_015652167.1 hypothetical protein ABB37_09639 [Leptomonas pyrrhocoris]
MSTQPNLDFYARVPTRRDVAKARLAEQRNTMYTWRSDAAQTEFDPRTGARRGQRHVYSPRPTQRYTGSENNSSACNRNSGAERRAVRMGSGRMSGKGDYVEQETTWSSAADRTGDRRRWWRQTNFTFSPDHFRTGKGASAKDADHRSGRTSPEAYTPYIHDIIVFCKPMQHLDGADTITAAAAAPPPPPPSRSGTEVVLAVTCNGAEARARELQAAEEAKSGEMLSLSSLSPVSRMQPQTNGYTYAPSSTPGFDEGGSIARTAAAAAATGTVHGSVGGVPYAATQPSAMSFDEEISTPGDTKVKPGNGAHATQSALRHSSKSTWCDVVGPTMASKQRALTMAEGIYGDLVAGEAQRTGTAYGSAASLRMATVPTCELAYSLRSSYMRSTQAKHEQGGRHGSRHESGGGGVGGGGGASGSLSHSAAYPAGSPPSKTVAGVSTSAISRATRPGTSQSYPSPQQQQQQQQNSLRQPPRPQRSPSANTTLSNSGVQVNSLYGNGPHRRTTTAAGSHGPVDAPFLKNADGDGEDVHEDGGTAISALPHPGSTRDFAAIGVPSSAAAAVAAEAGEGSVNLCHQSPLPPPPSQLPARQQRQQQQQQSGKAFSPDHSMASSSAAAASRTLTTAEPHGADSVNIPCGETSQTAPPTLSQLALEREMSHHDHHHHHHRNNNTSNSTVAGGQRTSQRSSPLVGSGRPASGYPVLPSKPDTDRHAHSAGARLATQTRTATTGDGAGDAAQSANRSRHRRGRRLPALRNTTKEIPGSSGRGQRSGSTGHAYSALPPLGGEDAAALLESGRPPAEAKETRVYAVRMRTAFTSADAVLPKPREPQRRGVPVLLPDDWQ